VFETSLSKKRAVGSCLLVVILIVFLAFNRFPKLDIVQEDLDAVTGPQVECFQGFCIEAEPDSSFLSRWWDFSLTYFEIVAAGMVFAFVVAGLTEAFLFPSGAGSWIARGGLFQGTLKGLGIGPVMNLCSACIVPVTSAFRGRGAGIGGTVAMVQGSSTLNLPAILMALVVFTPMLGGSRIVVSVIGGLLIGPLVAMIAGEKRRREESIEAAAEVEPVRQTWGEAIREASVAWAKSAAGYVLRIGPIMLVAGLASGLAIQWLGPDTVETYLGNDITGVAIAATLGVLINVPLLFEIPLVVLLLLLGMGVAPAATLLFAAAAGGPVTFWGLARLMPRRAIAGFAGATWGLGIAVGVAVLAIGAVAPSADFGIRTSVASAESRSEPETVPVADLAIQEQGPIDSGPISPSKLVDSLELGTPVTPFTNVAATNLDGDFDIWNDRPGVAVFDYDRDGDLDFYVTTEAGNGNRLYKNLGDGAFINVGEQAGVAAIESHSTGVVACDLNNDGFQDLYVGAWGDPDDGMDFRTPREQGNRDRLYLNSGDGSFREITDEALGEAVNVRSAASIACADVDGDGWLDLYVGNLADEDFRTFDSPSHPGHYNVLYLNNGDLTFTEVSEQAGVRGSQILMRSSWGQTIRYRDPETGEEYEGYDPAAVDLYGYRIGDPTGQTHSVLFFDYDDDRDMDLWVANDGDRFRVYRNDSSPGEVMFVPVSRAMGLDKVGAWMGFAVGDYDGDSDLDVFVANIGYHFRLYVAEGRPNGSCNYHEYFHWGTCLHYLLRNDGVADVPGAGTVGVFPDVAWSTRVEPSPIMPPASLDTRNIHPLQSAPTGLAAYDFGFGSTFFDYDNDGIQDLYWLGSTVARGEGPRGNVYPAAGRMLRGRGGGSFEDITVRAHLLDIVGVDYSPVDALQFPLDLDSLRINSQLHENGKGLAHGDLNGDGYVDLIGTNSSGPVYVNPAEALKVRAEGKWPDMETKPAPGPMFVWMNGGGEHHWITLRLQGRMAIDGTGSNADGIGARVYLKTAPPDGDGPLSQVQEVRAGSSYLSMDSIDLEFGIGSATTVDEILVIWPSGREQVLVDVPADQVLTITEPAEQGTTESLPGQSP
jgi:uncharacterized membrane protein YraQ (UPF0718 family)